MCVWEEGGGWGLPSLCRWAMLSFFKAKLQFSEMISYFLGVLMVQVVVVEVVLVGSALFNALY